MVVDVAPRGDGAPARSLVDASGAGRMLAFGLGAVAVPVTVLFSEQSTSAIAEMTANAALGARFMAWLVRRDPSR
jgi:hypothetical protein